jgi:NADH-quinone oxidoreductase subunit A
MRLASIEPYAAIAITVVVVGVITGAMLLLAHLLGPKRRGPVKDSAYESGVPLIVDTKRRLHVRFYLVAMLFLLFDVELIFMWPWVLSFYRATTDGTAVSLEHGGQAGAGFLLVGMGIFFALLVFGLFYEWRRGAFHWDQA